MLGQQVIDFFIIYFEITATDQELFICLLLFNNSENMSECRRNNASQVFVLRNAHHSMSLPTPCLTIGKDCSIVTFENRFNEWKCAFIIDIGLLRISVVDSVISKCFWSYLAIHLLNYTDLLLGLRDIHAALVA